jgi:hypothetical protein
LDGGFECSFKKKKIGLEGLGKETEIFFAVLYI